jgi:hypothetical protein
MNLTIEKPNLTKYQEDFLYNDSRFTITEASTKIGKTFAHIWWQFEMAHLEWNKPNYNHWWVAPVYAQAKIAFNRMSAKVSQTGLYKINQSNLIITTPGGVHIHFKSAEKPDNLFGEDVYSIVFDEAPRARVEAFYALRSTITATGGKMKLIGNFGGTANWMHQLKENALNDSQYSYHKITAWDAVKAGILSQEEIEQAQRDLPPKIFKQLYLAEEQENDDMLCSYDSIKDLWTNTHVKTGDKYISADIALHGSDKFKLGVWDGMVLIQYLEIDKMDAPEVEKIIKGLSEKHSIKRSNIVYDADGLGSFLRGYLKGAKPFVNGSKSIGKANYKNLKSQCAYKLAEKINSGEIYINCETNKSSIIQELECLQSHLLDSDGKIQILPKANVKEMIGRSPDDLDMLIMRMYFEVQPKRVAPKPIVTRRR